MICWDRRSFPTKSAKISTWQRKVRNGDNPAMLLRFNSYELDKGRRELRLDDVSVHVEPQVLDLLIYLVANRDHVRRNWRRSFVADFRLPDTRVLCAGGSTPLLYRYPARSPVN